MHDYSTLSLSGIPENAVVAVGLSGGADSLYTLVALHDAGIRVMGVHGLFANALPSFCNPPAREQATALQDALGSVCRQLDVPFHVIDCTNEFTESVVFPFIAAYAGCETPNPCAWCNLRIKFGAFLDKVLALGATRIATGHYARFFPGHPYPILLQGADPVKDQSYFLALVPGDRLQYACFPLGDSRKADVQRHLADLKFTPPQQKESQDVCFVPEDDYRIFLPQMAGFYNITLPGEGQILLTDGQTLGTHKGLWQYTEGQRKGLNVPWKERLHVIAKEQNDNVLRLGPREAMNIGGCYCREVNILVPQDLWPEVLLVKTRYKEPPRRATVHLTWEGNEQIMTIRYLQPESLMAPGQIAAVYMPCEGMSEPDGRPVLRLVAGGVLAGSLPLQS